MSKKTMPVSGRKFKFGKHALVAAAAVAMVGAMAAVPAAAYADSASADGLVTCSAYRAAEPAPELLGICSVGTNTAWAKVGELTWSAPYFYIMGTSRNSFPDPYLVNAVTNAQDPTAEATPSIKYDSYRQGGPMASMNAYGTNGNEAIWDMQPDIILGNNKGYDYNSAEFAQAAAEANGWSNYKVYGAAKNAEGVLEFSDKGVVYDSTNIYTMIDTMYALAFAADECVAESDGTKSLRYGDATTIATQYEEFCRGVQGYVLRQLNNNGKEKKTVALINNYDATNGTYTLVQTGVAEGTATANRYLEACQMVATNLGDTTQTVTADDLADVDLILLGSQAGGESITSTEGILSSLPTECQNKTFYVNSTNGSAGSCYGVVMNSVENAQNFARILPCLYPEYLDQSDMIAYYYKNFYHLNDGDLANTIANAMDGVRNWNNTGGNDTTWTEADVDGFDNAAVEEKILSGCDYIIDNAETLGAEGQTTKYLLLTDDAAADVEERVVDADVTSTPVITNGKAYFSVTALDGATYQWQWTKPGNKWRNCTASTADESTMMLYAKSYRSNYQYRCIITTADGQQVISDTAQFNLVSCEADTTPVAVGKMATMTVTTSAQDATYQWKWSKDGITWKNCTMKTAQQASMNLYAKSYRANYYYACFVTTDAGTVASNAIHLEIE